MVRKLMKYEFAFYFKRLLPLGLLVLGTALLNRILQFFEADNTPYRIIFGSSVVLLVIAILAFLLGILVTVFCFRLKKWMSEKDRRDF